MDILSIIGVVMGVACVLISMALDGGNLGSLLQLPAFVIVGGGTIGAVLLQTPLKIFLRGLKMLLWVFLPPRDDSPELVETIMQWIRISRRQSILALDAVADQQKDPFLRQGLRLVVDGVEPSQIRNVMETMIMTIEHDELLGGEIYEGMGGYAPTVGILGAVMGLITVMSHLDDPSKLGSGIATAFVATVYGVASANLLFLPIGNKLRFLARRRARRLEMITEGMVGMAIMEKPIQLEMRLRSYLGEGEGSSGAGAGEADANPRSANQEGEALEPG
ncbi:MAG TPA: flagellar motor protein [Stellaceae bacterium]|nr:flagellar motor protein [Stellaceae bacterium]